MTREVGVVQVQNADCFLIQSYNWHKGSILELGTLNL